MAQSCIARDSDVPATKRSGPCPSKPDRFSRTFCKRKWPGMTPAIFIHTTRNDLIASGVRPYPLER
ncbi:MAG: hypothetical protein ACJAVZ_001641 [Afipia broomeae]|jgi:hypothetical protein|uniref:Uncharacterized protein n=1 Tax=Afipia broomeae ATCC 49717 TaxID=883078 RepID=K8PM41_9BRAD|nr:hypothetical protein HMPREF9695_00931 [Afipia broomeae ATCC 49717]